MKLDDGFAEHPKVLSVSVQARWAYISAICYTSRRLTDGVIPRSVLSALSISPKLVSELVNASLWDNHGDDFMIHDYLEYNSTKAEIEERRKVRAEAGHRGGLRSGNTRASKGSSKNEANASTLLRESLPVASHTDEANANPIPIPIRNTSVSGAFASQDADTHPDFDDVPVAVRELRETILLGIPQSKRHDSATIEEAQLLAEDFAGKNGEVIEAISAIRRRGEVPWPNAIRKQIQPSKPKPVGPVLPPLDMRYAPEWFKEKMPK